MLQEEIGLTHYLEVLWRRRWAIVVVFTIVFCVFSIGIALKKTDFQAQSKVVVKNDIYNRQSMLTFAVGTDAPATTVSPEAYEQIINGLPFAERVGQYLTMEGLPLDPIEIHSALKAIYQPPDLITIIATSKDSERAVQFANTAATVFVEYTKSLLSEQLMKGRETARIRQHIAQKEVESLENRITEYHRELGFIDISEHMIVLRRKVADFEQARGEVITELEIRQAHRQELLNLAQAGSAGDLHLEDPRIEEYRELQMAISSARIKYTDNHPKLKNLRMQVGEIESRLQEAIARTGSSLSPEAFLTLKEDLAMTEGQIANVETAIESWTRQIEEVEDTLAIFPEKLAYLTGLRTELEAAHENLTIWTTRLEEVDFKDSMAPANASIVEAAIFAGPALGKPTMVLLAMIIAVMMALGTGLIAEFADTTLREPEEILTMIGLPYLGSIVKIKEPRQIVFENGHPILQVGEAYTRVYSNIKFAEVENPFRSIMVTSARKGEGKSTTLMNLACAIAAAGKRVIVVDSDLRNPTLPRILGLNYKDGLTSVMAGETTLDEALKETDHPGLQILPGGPTPPNPAELLHSRAMKDIIKQLEERADLVIFDTPPILLVADAMLLGGEVNAAIMVAESGGVSRKAVLQVKESLEKSKVRILGVILNKVLETPGAFYNYYSYYKSYREPEAEAPQQGAVAWLKGIRKTMGGRS